MFRPRYYIKLDCTMFQMLNSEGIILSHGLESTAELIDPQQ